MILSRIGFFRCLNLFRQLTRSGGSHPSYVPYIELLRVDQPIFSISMRDCRSKSCSCRRSSRASRVFCPAERPILAHHHASGSVFSRSPPETCRVSPNAFWPRSAGSTTSGRYYAANSSSSFRRRRSGTGSRSSLSLIGGIAGCRASVRAGVSPAGFPSAFCVTLPTNA